MVNKWKYHYSETVNRVQRNCVFKPNLQNKRLLIEEFQSTMHENKTQFDQGAYLISRYYLLIN